jgi:hypothetical protein
MPLELEMPVVIEGRVVSKVMQDLIVYLVGPSELELEFLIDLYESICPLDHLVNYKIGEIEHWVLLAQPELTAQGRMAAAARVRRPYLQPVRQRIRDGRAFEVQFWDGQPIDDPEGSWSFSCRSIQLRSTGLHAFVRILIPLQADPEILRTVATTIADNIELCSGHGGFVFVYDPWLKADALDAIYALARRFWGVDVEDLNRTLPSMKKGIKGVNWITLVGRWFLDEPETPAGLDDLAKVPNVEVDQRKHATVLVAGPCPAAGDQHRPDHSLAPYFAVAKALEPLFLNTHPDFSSERFITNGNTVGWLRRFIDPAGWR